MYAPLFIEYEGKKYRHTSTSRYYYYSWKKNGKRFYRALHRYIWEQHYKQKIPCGFCIHHSDGNILNNSIENLCLMMSSEHTREHMKKVFKSEDYRRRNRIHLQKIQESARKWHSSPEGIEEHKRIGKLSWKGENRKRKEMIIKCKVCGKERLTWSKETMFCSIACSLKFAYHSHRYWTEKRICAICGKEFITNRHAPSQCCGRKCGAILRWRKKR